MGPRELCHSRSKHGHAKSCALRYHKLPHLHGGCVTGQCHDFCGSETLGEQIDMGEGNWYLGCHTTEMSSFSAQASSPLQATASTPCQPEGSANSEPNRTLTNSASFRWIRRPFLLGPLGSLIYFMISTHVWVAPALFWPSPAVLTVSRAKRNQKYLFTDSCLWHTM